MSLPNLRDVTNINGGKMKKVIKAAKADKKVGELTKKDEPKKHRSVKEIRSKLYGKD